MRIPRIHSFVFSFLFAAASLFVFGCSGDDNALPLPDGGADATAPADASLDGAGDSSPGALDGGEDAPLDASYDAPSDTSLDTPSDAPDDALDAADATQTADAGPPPDGVQITPPLYQGNDSLPVPVWLGGGIGGPLVYEWADEVANTVTFEAISAADGGVNEVVLLVAEGEDWQALHFATNGSALIYTDPSGAGLYRAPLDATDSPIQLATEVAGAGCQAVGADAVYAYCATGGVGNVSLQRIALASDAGAFETIANVAEYARPQAIEVSGATLYVNESVTLEDGGLAYSIEEYPATGLPDGGAPIVVASGSGAIVRTAVAGDAMCWSRSVEGQGGAGPEESYAITCATLGVPSSQQDIVPLGATTLAGLAVDTGALFYGVEGAVEQIPIGGVTPTKVANAYESYPPTLAIDATQVYWADSMGSIPAAPR